MDSKLRSQKPKTFQLERNHNAKMKKTKESRHPWRKSSDDTPRKPQVSLQMDQKRSPGPPKPIAYSDTGRPLYPLPTELRTQFTLERMECSVCPKTQMKKEFYRRAEQHESGNCYHLHMLHHWPPQAGLLSVLLGGL